jgi:ABC-type multidrug transport system ATPase subunit
MLSLESLGLTVPATETPLLSGINLCLPTSHFAAIVGPSGCGKSTLLKVIAGILPHNSGTIRWRGRELNEHDLSPGELGYVPQFTCSQPQLTVEENIYYTARLRRSCSPAEIQSVVEGVQEQTGLSELRDRRASVLSGGQLRRLGLAMELTTNPSLLLADEVTSGLDPKSEEEITALLAHLALERGRLVILVTHSLRFLNQYDSITVLSHGRLAYSAHPGELVSYFNVSSPEDIYPRLMEKRSSDWAEEWTSSLAKSAFHNSASAEDPTDEILSNVEREASIPGFWSHTWTWFLRRLKLFSRDHTQVFLQLTLLLIFPFVVSLFAYQGLPSVRNMTMSLDTDVVQQLRETLAFTVQSSRIGTLVSGLTIFQVILLALMGSNNSAREVISQRVILEKEKLAGLRPGAVLAAITAFLSLLVILQSAWMTLFVRVVCQFPGDLFGQFLPFALLTAAMTSLCLAISSWSSSSEQASLGSLYLVGFQLPLSGVLLALPNFLGWIIRPFISSYWTWSGYLQTLKSTRFYDLVQAITETPIASTQTAVWVLSLHLALGLFLSYLGIRRSYWQ